MWIRNQDSAERQLSFSRQQDGQHYQFNCYVRRQVAVAEHNDAMLLTVWPGAALRRLI